MAFKLIKNDFKPGDILRVEYPTNTGFRRGELVVVVDGDRFPSLKDELSKRVGDAIGEFICVQGMESDNAGFYSWARFRRPTNVAVA